MLQCKNKLILLSILSLVSGAVAEDLSVAEMLFGEEKPEEVFVTPAPPPSYVEWEGQPKRLSVRYTSPDGIGYKSGYSTLEGFFSSIFQDAWVPFADIRGHIFDDGRTAANVGLGLRYLTCSHVWGINGYHDYRGTVHKHYNQAAAGLEMLGDVWDVRVNGYLPVGHKQSRLYHTKFKDFEGNSMYLRSKQNFAMKGGNAEVGAHVDHFDSVPLYFAAGPYYLTGKGGSTWGGEFRVAADFFHRYLRLEGNTSYDHYFKWIGQGQISINLPLGKGKREECSSSCDINIYTRSVQRVDRNEIIAVGTRHPVTEAINPATKDPYFFVFVNNTSSSLGTYESPYPSLALAQTNSGPGQIIYVFPGDGSTRNMDAGITLQNSQMFLGASTIHPIVTTLGNVSIPALASTMPSITNTTVAPVITLANNNTVSGFYIENNTSNGIFGSGVINFVATQNQIVGGGVATGTGEGILLTDISGQVTINDNLLSQASPQTVSGSAIHILQTYAQCNASFDNDTINCQFIGQPIDGIFADLSGTGSIGTLSVTNTTLTNINLGLSTPDVGIEASLLGASSISNVIVSNSTLNNWNSGIEFDLPDVGSITNITVANSNIFGGGLGTYGLYANLTGSGSIANLAVLNSSILYNFQPGAAGLYVASTSSGGISSLSIQNCELNFNNYNLFLGLTGTGGIENLSIMNSNLNNGRSANIFANVLNTSFITNFTISNCNLNYGGVYDILIAMTGTSAIANLSVSNCNMNYSSNIGAYIEMAGTSNIIENLTFSNCSLSNSLEGLYVQIPSGCSITNLAILDCILNNNSQYGIYIPSLPNTPAYPIQNMTVSNSSFSGSPSCVYITGGSIESFDFTSCNCASNGYGLFLSNQAINNFNMSNNVFTQNSSSLTLNCSTPNGVIANNQFNYSLRALQIEPNVLGSSSLSILNNTFAGPVEAVLGYAANVFPTAGTLCVDFVGNTATPVAIGSYDPYYFNGLTAPISLTAESTQANNVGQIKTTGTVTVGGCSL